VGALELLAWRGAAAGESVIAAAAAGSGRFVAATCTRTADDVEEQTPPQILEAADFADFLIASRGAGNCAVVMSGEDRRRDSSFEEAAREAGLGTRTAERGALEQLALLARFRAAHGRVLDARELVPLYVGQHSARPNRHRVAVPAAAEGLAE
jgi:hypothetical protein